MRKVLMIMLAIFMLAGCTDHKDGSLSIISEAKAKSIAIEECEVTGKNVHNIQNIDIEYITQDDLEFYSVLIEIDAVVYHFNIDAYTGKVIVSNVCIQDDGLIQSETNTPLNETVGNTTTIEHGFSEEKIKEIALSQVVGATHEHITQFQHIENHEHGALIYEGKITYQGNEYCFEIDGCSGGINKWECTTHHVTEEHHDESHNSSHHEKENH